MTSTLSVDAWMPASFSSKPSAVDGIRRNCRSSDERIIIRPGRTFNCSIFFTKEISMARIFITGSSDGLGLMAAQLLVEQGHSVVLHARNVQRAEATRRRLPGAEAIVTGDLA